jgi:hypothetical protein
VCQEGERVPHAIEKRSSLRFVKEVGEYFTPKSLQLEILYVQEVWEYFTRKALFLRYVREAGK